MLKNAISYLKNTLPCFETREIIYDSELPNRHDVHELDLSDERPNKMASAVEFKADSLSLIT